MPTFQNVNSDQKTLQAIGIDGLAKNVKYGDKIESYHWLDEEGDGSVWSKTADTPVFDFVLASHSVALNNETKTQSVTLSAGVFEIRSDIDVTIKPNCSSAIGYPLSANEKIQISNDKNIALFVLTSSGNGTVTILDLLE